MANNYIPGFTPSLHGQPVKRMALGGRMESGRWFNEGRDRDTGDMPYAPEVASAAPAVAQSIASSPVAALTAAAPTAAAPTAAPTVAAYQQPTPEPAQANYGFDPYDLSGFDMYGLGEYASQFYQQPTPQPAATNYQSLPTPQPVQTAPYVDYATPTSYQRQPTPQPVETAPYYGDYGFDPYGIGNFDMSAYQLPQSGVTAARSQPTPALPTVASADYSQFMQPYDGSPEMGALPYTAPQSAATSYSQPATPPGALPPGMSWGAYSNPNDPTSQYTVTFNSEKRGNRPLTVTPETPVFLYDNKTKQVIASGIGKEGADAVAAAVSNLAAKDSKAWWDIYTGPPGATDSSQFKVAVNDPKNKSFGERFLNAMGTILPIAVSFIPGIGQLSLGAKIGAGVATGAASSALKGQDILKGGLIGGATAGLMSAPVLSGGKNLSGVIGGALEKVPLVGDALKDVTGALNKAGGSTWNQAANEIVTTATKSAAAPLVDKAAAALIGSAAFQPDLSGLDQLSFQYGLPEVSQQPPVEEEGVASTVIGRKPSDLAPIAGGAAGSVVSGYDPVKNEITAVADKTKPELDEPASGATQSIVNEFVDPNEIVVSNKYVPPSLDDLATGAIGALAPSLLQPGPQAPTTPPKKDGLGIDDILKLLPLLGGAAAAGGGGALSNFAGARGPLNPIFSAQLPSPNMQAAIARPMSGIDWYRYGYGPEQSFFTNVPQGAANTSTAYTGYEGGLAALIEKMKKAGLLPGYADGGYAVGGPGDGREDKIPAMLSDGEYVIDAETVAMLGNGSSKAGADALDKFRVNIRKHKGRKLSKGEFSVDAKKPEQYLKGHK